MSKKLFISHSTKDDVHVDRIADALEKAGFTVWVDHRSGIPEGTPNWDRAIRQAIVDADISILLMSERSLASDICAAECLLVRELGDPLYVMRLEACRPENVWLYIKMIQYGNLITDFDDNIASLISALNGDTDKSLPQPVAVKLTGADTMRLYLPYLSSNPLRGREQDIEAIQSQINVTSPTILQLVGIGGLGKSRLAAEVALSHANGAIWHRCSSVSEPAELIGLLREHLKLPDDAKQTEVLVRLSEKCPLVVIDNAEDVLTDTDRHSGYSELLRLIIGRKVPVLMTARAVWDNLTPRSTHVLEGLKQLDVAKQIVADFAAANQVPLSDSQAIELAQKAQLHPRLIQFSVEQLHNDETDLVTILRRLDDLENEQRDYTIEELLDEMIRRTVEHMAEYARHGEDAKALLNNLTILKGFFPDAAIEALAPESLNDVDALLHARETLQKWQFLRRDRITKRFTLGELVPEALRRPHDDVFWAYAGFYTRRAGEIYSLEPENWKDYDDELPNVLAVGNALVTAVPNIISTLNKDQEIEGTQKNYLEMALVFFLDTRDFVTARLEFQRISWLRIGTIVAEFMNEGRYQGILLHSLAFALSLTGNNQEAVNYYEQALPITSEHGDRVAEGTVLNNLGRVWTQLGDAEKATYYLEKALPIRRELNDIDGETATLNNLGMLADSLGDKQQALKHYRRADKICSEVKDKRIQANTYSNMGTILDALGRRDEALKYYERAFAICLRIGDRRGAAIILNNTGKLYASLGNSEEAFNRFKQALKSHEAVGNVLDAATTLNNIGTLLIETGQAKESFEHLNKALNIQLSMGEQRGQATTLANIGMAHHALKENLTAIESLKQAIDKFTLCGDRYNLVSANANISVVYQEIGQLDNAMKYMRDAIQIGAQIEHPDVQLLSGQYAVLVVASMYK